MAGPAIPMAAKEGRPDCLSPPLRGGVRMRNPHSSGTTTRGLGRTVVLVTSLIAIALLLTSSSPSSGFFASHDPRHPSRNNLGRSWYDDQKVLPPELRGRDDLGPSNEAILWSSFWTFGRRQIENVFRHIEISIGSAISKQIVNKMIPRIRKTLWPRGQHHPDIDRLRILVKMLEEGEVVLKHGARTSGGVPAASRLKSGCCGLSRRGPRPLGKRSTEPVPVFVRLSPDGEALVWCRAADRDKANLELGGQHKFEPAKIYSHMLLGDVMFVVKGQETDGFQQTGLPGRDHLCLSLVSKANDCLDLQFASEETRELWAEALRDSLWARAECMKKGLLDERIPEPKRLTRILKSRFVRPLLFAAGLTACSMPLPMRWLATGAACIAAYSS